ncbi:MAG: glutamine synthetase family protein [Rhodobacteraceae bacterium]|nr:glutamine synthetase family protein [Paracoccaceae bacterium]
MSGDLKTGPLACMGLLGPAECDAAEAVLAQMEAAGTETLRLLFADQHGILRGKTLVRSAARSAFEAGVKVPSTLLLKDTSHRTAFDVWDQEGQSPMEGASDVLLVPVPSSFRILPWSRHSAMMLCGVVGANGAPLPFCSRRILCLAQDRLAAEGLVAKIGLEVEFHIFDRVDPALSHAQSTMPGLPVETRNLTQGYQFLTETRYAEAEDILDVIRRAAQDMGMPVRTVEIEMGPSQFEFTFDPSDPMTQADTMVMFRTMVKEICAARGLHASFMAKPKLDNVMANGWHIHQSVQSLSDGRNLFAPDEPGELTPQASGWIAGLLDHAAESALLTTPTVNGYKRYQPYQLAPNRIQWGHDNRGAMIRALMNPDDPASRIENRAPDSTANPYLAIAAQLIAGLEGVTGGHVAPAPTRSPYEGDAAQLPTSLGTAIDAFAGSRLYRRALGDEFVDYLVTLKKFEWERYLITVSEWEQNEYFNLF